eukprot:TRINITY_DN13054_c0_g1_i1.p1 TRINITY_DN13054_c0_g1~~TRINITY_DN13054_c0_g1_i1.p1  ORF type:complete len:323 (+),score=33.09 TRINITY_DN13054_c0_g1_i1:93-1061(+)
MVYMALQRDERTILPSAAMAECRKVGTPGSASTTLEDILTPRSESSEASASSWLYQQHPLCAVAPYQQQICSVTSYDAFDAASLRESWQPALHVQQTSQALLESTDCSQAPLDCLCRERTFDEFEAPTVMPASLSLVGPWRQSFEGADRCEHQVDLCREKTYDAFEAAVESPGWQTMVWPMVQPAAQVVVPPPVERKPHPEVRPSCRMPLRIPISREPNRMKSKCDECKYTSQNDASSQQDHFLSGQVADDRSVNASDDDSGSDADSSHAEEDVEDALEKVTTRSRTNRNGFRTVGEHWLAVNLRWTVEFDPFCLAETWADL